MTVDSRDPRDERLDVQLRAFLVAHAEAGAALAAPDHVVADRIVARLAGRRRTGMPRLVPVLVALLLLTILAAGAIYLASQLLRDPYSPDSELLTVALPGNPIAIGAAFGSVWVAPFDSAGSVLVELDPATGIERRQIAIPGPDPGGLRTTLVWPLPRCPTRLDPRPSDWCPAAPERLRDAADRVR